MSRIRFVVAPNGTVAASDLDAPALQAAAVAEVDLLEGDAAALAACAEVTAAISGPCVVSVDPAAFPDMLVFLAAIRALADSVHADATKNGPEWPA